MSYHTSVLLQETIDFLNVQDGKQYIDATLGGGGHTQEILERGGKVLGIDADQDAIDYVGTKDNLTVAKGNFKDIDRLARENGFEQVAGILFDLGISSHHVDDAARGFSFQKEGPLDMRMDRELGVSAADLINVLHKGQLYELFTKFGEERFAKSIAQGIVNARQNHPITTTTELSQIIGRIVPRSATAKHINPATRIFQALRIVVNDELTSIEEALPKAIELLGKNGRLVVISFHSLEDRIVKRAFLAYAEQGVGRVLTKRPLIPTEKEQELNKRSRSAKLRVFEKI